MRQAQSPTNFFMQRLAVFCAMAGLLLASAVARAQAQQVTGKDSIVQLYNAKALKLLNTGNYDSSKAEAMRALAVEENVVSYCLIAHMYNVEQDWENAIKYGKLAMKTNPGFAATYNELFSAYYATQRWQEAVEVVKNSEDLHISGFTPEQKITLQFALETQQNADKLIFVLLGLVMLVFFIPIYNASKNKVNYFTGGAIPRVSEAILAGGAVSGCLYFLFFAVSKQIWAMNPHYPTQDFAPNMRISIFEHDGIETFVLYGMMLVIAALTLALTGLLLKLRAHRNIYLAVIFLLLCGTAVYFLNAGFFPPMPAQDNNLVIPIAVPVMSIGLYILYQKQSLLARIAAFLLMGFAGLISAGPASLFDLMFILDPALRLVKGFKVQEIYFQYDIFLSLLAAAWMKMNISVESFPYVGQLSFFLFYVAAFFLTDKLFKSKGLSVVFIVGLILVRYYAVSSDIPTILQTTPLRLDLWIIVLLLAFRKGVYHWSVGAALGLLVIFHRNLGIMYLSSYLELVFCLWLIDLASEAHGGKISGALIMTAIKKHLRLASINIGIVIGSVALCYILFHEFFSASAQIYRVLGVGMIPIHKLSFFWYVPVVIGALVVFAMYLRERTGEAYMRTALFIALLVVSNSMYFYGRSHENNILNASAIMVLALFTLFDLIIFSSAGDPVIAGKEVPVRQQAPPAAKPKQGKQAKPPAPPKAESTKEKMPAFRLTWRMLALSLPFVFILCTSYYYNGQIRNKSGIQLDNLARGKFSYAFTDIPVDTAAVRTITHNSQKVYFLDYYYDFYYYYFGGYTPQGYYSPCAAWVFKKDVLQFLQGLLDQGYYIVYRAGDFGFFGEYSQELKYNQSSQLRNFVALSRQKVKLDLPETLPSVFHMGIRDSLASSGLDYKGLTLGDSFTIEVILRPVGTQLAGATIMNNMSKTDGIKGFTLQRNGGAGNQYGFGFGNGTKNMTSVFFPLQDNMWQYVVLTVNRDTIKSFVNGSMTSYAIAGGLKYQNSDIPLTIGNQPDTRDARFTGYIKEINISNGCLTKEQIGAVVQKLVREESPNP